jgi:hypothetical protein
MKKQIITIEEITIFEKRKGKVTDCGRSLQIMYNNKMICQLNVYDDVEKNQILTTFQPLNCQEYETNKKGKAIAIKNKTKRYCTAI